MPRVSVAFFATAVLFLGAGMMWGMYMGATEDFALSPAHAHLNLLGWVTLALYGTFYALARETILPRIAWANYLLSTLGTLVMIPSLAAFLLTNDGAKWGPVIAAGAVASFLGLLMFGLSVSRELLRRH